MVSEHKYAYKTSYRINNKIKLILDNTLRDVCKKTRLDLSGGKVSRAFWEMLALNPSLRKKCIDCVCKKILSDEATNDYEKKSRSNRNATFGSRQPRL